MPKGHIRPERDETARLCGMGRSFKDAEAMGSPPHERCVARRVARGDQGQEPRVTRQSHDSPLEALFDPGVDWCCARHAEAAGDL